MRDEKYYWIRHDGRISKISEDKYFKWTCIKQNNHRVLKVTKNNLEYYENGLCLNVKKELLKRMLDL